MTQTASLIQLTSHYQSNQQGGASSQMGSEQQEQSPIDWSLLHNVEVNCLNTITQPVPHESTNIHPMQTRSKHGIYKPKKPFNPHVTLHPLLNAMQPYSYKQALSHPMWKIAMLEEFTALEKNKTWTLVPLPPKRNVVRCKWILKIKRHADGTVERYKAHFVAKDQFGL